jgi:hypothetical protein
MQQICLWLNGGGWAIKVKTGCICAPMLCAVGERHERMGSGDVLAAALQYTAPMHARRCIGKWSMVLLVCQYSKMSNKNCHKGGPWIVKFQIKMSLNQSRL